VLKVCGANKEEEMKIIKKAYKFRIYPTLEQITFFSKNFGCVRKVHNLMLDDRKKGYEEYKSTGIKTEYPTPAKYKCKSNQVQSYTTNNQNTIYIKDSYIKLPKLKSLVKIKLHREIKGIIKSVTIWNRSRNKRICNNE